MAQRPSSYPPGPPPPPGYPPGYPVDPTLEPREGEVREGEVVEPETEAPPLTEQQIELNKLDAYYAKVLGDLQREHQEADAVHDAAEKRMEDIEAQKTQIDAEYAERKAAIEAEPAPEDALAKKPPSRWGGAPAVVVVKKPDPQPDRELLPS